MNKVNGRNEAISRIFRMASVVCTLLVVYRHSLNFAAFYPQGAPWPENYNTWIQGFAMQLTRLAVPLFFFTSGYYFFKDEPLSPQRYWSNLCKRFRSLAVPFVLWTLVNVVVLLGTRQLPWEEFRCVDLLRGAYAFHLWYVGALVVLSVVSPIVEILRRYRVLAILLLPWLLWRWMPVDCCMLSSEGMLFFLLGALARPIWMERMVLPTWGLGTVMFLWLVIPLVPGSEWHWAWSKVDIIAGVVAMWNICYRLCRCYNAHWASIASCSFFIYCAHFFVIKVMKVGVAHHFPNSDAIALLCYLVLPILTWLGLYGVAQVLKHFTPRLYGYLAGGR